MSFRAFKFYLHPTAAQVVNLDRIRFTCCELYNAALQEKRDAFKRQRLNLGCAFQQAELTDVKEVRPDVGAVHSQVLQNVLKRLHRAFDAFFRRVKAGQKAGYPRFRSSRRYDSFTFPQVSRKTTLQAGGVTIENGRLKVHGIPGAIKVKWHRPLEGIPKTATFKREGDRWYVIFSCEGVLPEVLPLTGRECGIDLGLTTFAMLDDGTAIENPRCLRKDEGKIVRAQRLVSKRKRGSRRRNKARTLLAGHHHHVANARRDHAHKTARMLVNEFERIAVENLNVEKLSRGMLSKSVHDAGWGTFIAILTSKAANAGRELIVVDPAGTSQECSGCGTVVRKELSERVHRCDVCGLVCDRDVNAARNIRSRAFAGPDGAFGEDRPQGHPMTREAVCFS